MKKVIIIVMLYIISMYGITRNVPNGSVFTIDNALSNVNTFTQEAVLDSISAVLVRHGARDTTDTDSCHVLPDTQAAPINAGNIQYANNIRTWLVTHFAKDTTDTDSCHILPDLQTVRSALSVNAKYPQVNDYIESLITNYNAHAIKDTTDSDSCHILPDSDLITEHGYAILSLEPYTNATITAIGSSVSSGATFFIDATNDDLLQSFVHLDSMVVNDNGLVDPYHLTNLWKYIRVYCKYRTDGTYKLQIYTGGK